MDANGGSNNNHVDIMNITIEEPDNTSDLMLQLEDATTSASASASSVVSTAPASYKHHGLFYRHFDYDPLLYFAEYNQNNDNANGGNTAHNNDTRNESENDNDTMIMMMESEDLHIRKGAFHNKIMMTTSLYSLEPISESDNEEEEEEKEEEE